VNDKDRTRNTVKDVIKHSEVDDLRELLVGRRATHVDVSSGTLALDDGTVLELVGNEGCAGCPNGVYVLRELNGVDNVITAVEVADERVERYGESEWKIFVYTEHQKINLAAFRGDDGNEWYGTGFSIRVRRPK
jgi:hypothetical protein